MPTDEALRDLATSWIAQGERLQGSARNTGAASTSIGCGQALLALLDTK